MSKERGAIGEERFSFEDLEVWQEDAIRLARRISALINAIQAKDER